ncbi:MAG: gamma-glutamyl-gamma-aminobutyrate hydrolase family protein, partial [Candidatus Berkelbacteria bacterium]
IQNDPIFANISNLKVYESHRWIVKKVGEDLLALAKSEDGIEVIKHKNRLIYGVQFHPEMLADDTCDQTIIKNFLTLI